MNTHLIGSRSFRIFKLGLVGPMLSSALFTAELTADDNRTSEIVVDQSADSTSGNCEMDGQCNLRAALAKAAGSEGDVDVRLSVDSKITEGEIVLSGLAKIRLFSNRARRITGNGQNKLFQIGDGLELTIDHQTISNFGSFNAGVIVNQGELILSRTVIENNKASCFGNGAMTAFATCYAGALVNHGQLTLKDGVRFRTNQVEATASTASFTTANASGGAIVSNGTITFDGKVTFMGNKVSALANSGYHGEMPGGADASASGGAIANSGNIIITPKGERKCRFIRNEASAVASSVQGVATASSQGGAVITQDISGLNLEQSCVFEGNKADIEPNVSVYPAP